MVKEKTTMMINLKNEQDILIDQLEYTINYRGTKAKRLLRSESFIQHVNILYSCFVACLSIWSLLVDQKFISFIATIISIILVVSITYLNSQRYAARAKDLEANILDLRNLQSDLLVNLSEEKLFEKWEKFNSYLAASETEDNYDKLYYDVFEYSPSKNKEKVRNLRVIQFYAQMIVCILLKGVIILLPFIATGFLIYSMLTGTISNLDLLLSNS